MVRATLAGLLDRLREWWTVEDPEERIKGSGEVHLDPAYNGRYTAERELNRLAKAEEAAEEREQAAGPDE